MEGRKLWSGRFVAIRNFKYSFISFLIEIQFLFISFQNENFYFFTFFIIYFLIVFLQYRIRIFFPIIISTCILLLI